MKRARKGALEQDVFSKYWRKYYQHRQIVGWVKRKANKRERKQAVPLALRDEHGHRS